MRYVSAFFCVVLVACCFVSAHAFETIGGGTVDQAAIGPGPSHGVGAGGNYALVKNWNFGTDLSESTVTNINAMSQHFQYHDQFGTIANGTNYGSYVVAPNSGTALPGQPVENIHTDRPVREFTPNSLKTYLVPLNGATTVHPTTEKAGSGSFQAKWVVENGGSRLGQDLIWETRVRYDTPEYFWFAIWVAGNQWNGGAEIDLIESFGYDNGGGSTNYDGDYWHSSEVGGESVTNYHSNWNNAMESYGIFDFDATEWHTWTLEYRADDTFSNYVDGIEVQSGEIEWTNGGGENDEPINMSFIFDGAWGHKAISSVNHSLAASELEDVFYEWDYSRIYLSDDLDGDFDLDGDVDGTDFLSWQRTDGSPEGLALWEAGMGLSLSTISSEVQAVPEPSSATIALLLVGLLGVFWPVAVRGHDLLQSNTINI